MRLLMVTGALLAAQLAKGQAPAKDTTQRLPGVTVTAPAESPRARAVGFYDRKQQGLGRFVDRAALEAFSERRMSDAMAATIPGVAVRYGTGTAAWATSTRAPQGGSCAMCRAMSLDSIVDRYDQAKGARNACYMDVYLDGLPVYTAGQRPPASLFDLNSLPMNSIEAIEVYQSAAQMPARFNRTSGGCGAVVIWTR